MKRRHLLPAGAALAALLGGVGVAWWRHRPDESVTLDATEVAFWQVRLDAPDGQSVALSGFRGQPLLVNFWATWCPPCVEELPLLNAFHQAQRPRGWQVLGIAVDQPSAVRQWLARSPLGFPVVLAGLEGSEMSKRLGNQAGGLPFSLLFNPQGQVIERKLGQLHEADLKSWAARL